MATCSGCGEDNPDRFKFCGACGTPLAVEKPLERETRKIVTVLFCDVVESTRLASRLDPESMRHVMAQYFEIARAALTSHGGTVEKFIGDAVMGVFGIPVLHEDDALRAVRAASQLRDALTDLNGTLARDWGVELELRMGVNTGQVIAGHPSSGQTLVTGDSVNVAARLEQSAAPGEIIIGSVTHNLVRDAVIVEPITGLVVKGKDDPLEAYRLISVAIHAPGRARRTDTEIVGRERERRSLSEAFERSVVEERPHLFTIFGSAGVGKSRLVHEFLSTVRTGATIVQGRCLEYGDGITFWPIAEIVREAVDADETVDPTRLRQRIAEVLATEEQATTLADCLAALGGADESASRVDEVPWAFRKFLEALARRQPLVVILDDLHRAEATLLDLVEHVADWSRGVPILLVCVARPELLDVRTGWAGGKMNATSILLEPLGPKETASLVDNLLGDVVAEGVRSRIAAAAEGNPLFVEELVSMLTEQSLLVRGEQGWVGTGDFEALQIPPTISALLAARLDNLERSERSVIERASVVGKSFYRTAVTELSPVERRPEVSTGLMSLVRKELIRPERSSPMGDDSFQFRHLLIRDAAYSALPKRERAELHERFARWLQEVTSGLGQLDEIVGYHLEHACQLRAELGSRDSKYAELAQSAADYLARAGRRIAELADLPAATALLERAYHIAPVADRPAIAADLGSLLVQAGRLEDALLVTDEGAELSAGEPPLALLLTRAELRIERDGYSWVEATAEIEKLLPDLEASDKDLLIRALTVLGRVYSLQGSVSRGTEVMERVLILARESDDAAQIRRATSELAFHTVIGLTPVDEGVARCQVLLTEAAEDQRARASVLKTLSSLHALRGEFDEARRVAAESLAIMDDLGLRLAAARASVDFAMRELLAGDPLAAEAIARQGYETLELMNERAYKCNCAALLAQALHLQGLQHEASRFAEISRQTAGTSDTVGQYQWRTAQARVLAGRGQFSEAIALAKAAVELLERTDLVFLHGDALYDLAGVLRASGRLHEAEAAARSAFHLHERKGATAAAEVARDLADRIADDHHATV